MEQIKMFAKYKQFEDINDIAPEFIKVVLFKMKETIGFIIRTVVKSDKVFDKEPLFALKALIEYKGQEFSVSIERSTYEKTFLLNITINTEREKEFFSCSYNFKVAVLEFLKNNFGEVYYIQDTTNEKICADLYQRVHSIENDFRRVVTIFYIRKLGRYDLTKKLEKNVDEYSKWYRDKYRNSPFRNIESPLFNLMTEKLFETLKRPLFELDSEEKSRLMDSVNKLDELLDDLSWTIEFTINTMKLNDFRKKYKNEFKAYKKKSIFELYFKDTLGEDFETEWKKFSKMRNMVAHNKPICKDLYYDILKSCERIEERIERSQRVLDSFIPEEVFIVDAMYKQQQDELEAEANEIEYQREMAGLDAVWSEDLVVEKLSYDDQIKSLLCIIDEYKTVKRLIEEYSETYYKIDEKVAKLDMSEVNTLKKKIEGEFKIEIKVDTDLDEEDVLYDTKAEIMSILTEEILDLDHVYSEVDESNVLGYFTIDNSLAKFKDLDGNEYSVYIAGTLNPSHNHDEDIEIHLKKNKEIIKKGYININYGGFDSYDYFENQANNAICPDIVPKLDDFNKEVESIIEGIVILMQSKMQAIEKVDAFVEIM